jgi:hypothetical protein
MESATDATDEASTESFDVIIHPAGRLDGAGAAQFWTEVPALAACTGSGDDADTAIASTRDEIRGWLAWTRGPDSERCSFDLRIERAF